MGLIKDEELWIKALKTRNDVANSYNRCVAEDIVRKTRAEFYEMFVDLKGEIEKNRI